MNGNVYLYNITFILMDSFTKSKILLLGYLVWNSNYVLQ